VQLLHQKRGRPTSIVLAVYRKDLLDHSRRVLYYRFAYDRARCAIVEAGLADEDTAYPLPLGVMHEIGKPSRSDARVLFLAWLSFKLLAQGWPTQALVRWLRDVG
jgi:hypothetical protein